MNETRCYNCNRLRRAYGSDKILCDACKAIRLETEFEKLQSENKELKKLNELITEEHNAQAVAAEEFGGLLAETACQKARIKELENQSNYHFDKWQENLEERILLKDKIEQLEKLRTDAETVAGVVGGMEIGLKIMDIPKSAAAAAQRILKGDGG